MSKQALKRKMQAASKANRVETRNILGERKAKQEATAAEYEAKRAEKRASPLWGLSVMGVTAAIRVNALLSGAPMESVYLLFKLRGVDQDLLEEGYAAAVEKGPMTSDEMVNSLILANDIRKKHPELPHI